MDLFSTNYLTGVVNSLQNLPPQFLVDHFFPGLQTETSEEIHFDVELARRQLAPFVSPVVEGKVFTDQGFTTKTFKPGYIKPKTTWDPQRPLKRVMGEALTGNLTPADRIRILLGQTLTDHRNMIQRRLEWMAAQILTTGAVTISGELYKTVAVNFGRDAALTVVLGAPAKWDQAGVHPLADLQTWATLILSKGGGAAVDVVFTLDVWAVFKEHDDIKNRLTLQRTLGQMPSLSQSAVASEDAVYMGTIDRFNIYVYAGEYVDDNGAVQPMLPAGTVLLGSARIEGVKAFGAIQDEAAGYQAVPYFTKSWVENDPSRRFVMTQSAPLLVPYRPNASLCATVL